MKKLLILFPLLIVVVLVGIYVVDHNSEASPVGYPAPEPNMLSLVNAERAKVGAPALVEDVLLDQAASYKVADMVKFNTSDHQMPDGSPIYKYTRQVYPSGYQKAGENLAECQTSNTERVKDWVGSHDHYIVMVDPVYTNFGHSEAVNPKDGCTYSVTYFLKP